MLIYVVASMRRECAEDRNFSSKIKNVRKNVTILYNIPKQRYYFSTEQKTILSLHFK